MSITIEISPEIEAQLRERAAQQGAKLEEYLGALAQQWAGGNGVASVPPSSVPKTPQQKVTEFLAWANSHAHITAVADDSRESIYAGRGE